jgi:hypothetical protein
MSRLILIIVIVPLMLLSAYPQTEVPEPWLTHFERSGYLETPRYNESIDYFRKLSDASEHAEMFSFGISPQGRELYCIAVSKDGRFEPVGLSDRTKPVILIVNGIHSGEIGGKDASMILLREMIITGDQEHLFDNLDLLIVPIFSVDGHERFGPYNRINQNGPQEMGWRTTAQNLNLNRDWMKADTPEMQAMLRLISEWQPDFLIDTHSTNGADYQYTVTYILETRGNIYDETGKWLQNDFIPHMETYIEDRGYLVFPYVSMRQWYGGIESGLSSGASSPRFSSGYAAVQNRPGIVVETHMSKPYKDRVFSTKAMIESVLEYANRYPTRLLDMNRNADWISIEQYHSNRSYLPVQLRVTDRYRMKRFKGIEAERVVSPIAGGEILRYTGRPIELEVRFYDTIEVVDSVTVPPVYLIPREWDGIVERMKIHGIAIEILAEETTLPVTRYRFTDVRHAASSYEGKQRVDVQYDSYRETVTVPEGTYVVPTDQRTVRVIAHLLEPKSPDSFLRWGFFNTIFERKEYFELYVMEPIAREMLREDPSLQREFDRWLENNPNAREDPFRRLNFFYERSPYYDNQLNVYPVMRVE